MLLYAVEWLVDIPHGHQQHSGYYGTNIGKKRYKEENEYVEILIFDLIIIKIIGQWDL